MTESHFAHLSLGSNIQPETHLPAAIKLLAGFGEIIKTSSVWESEPVGGPGPNYWNLCILFGSEFAHSELKEKVINPIETELGRKRETDKHAPRTMDIDIVLFDGEAVGGDVWDLAYVVVPLAEILPDFQNPKTRELLHETATRLRRHVWLEARWGVLS